MARRATDTAAEWDAARLRAWLARFYAGEAIVALANREPWRHDRGPDGDAVATRAGGGLVTALEPLIQACGGTWVAHGAGTADRMTVDRRDGLNVPPANPRYRLRRVWLDAGEERRYYEGFANEGLWPLCHRAHVQPVFRSDDFNTYAAVNARFADAVCEETGTGRPLVLVQDYHFALAPRMIRERLPFSTIVGFWHIPWPHPDDFAICPWGRELLEGLLGNSILGFQTPEDCRNFVDTAARSLDAHVNRTGDVITYRGDRTEVRSYPVSIEWANPWVRQSPPITACRTAVKHELGLPADVSLGVGIDRLDYTKGISEKFLAIERLLEMQPALRGHFVFVQIAEPSRVRLPAYQAIRARVVETADRVNRRFGDGCHRPIVLLETRQEPAEVYRFLRAADVCYVGSLHDGMNLVAKEFVCARDDGQGVLVLSEFAGAARELTTALIVNPYDRDACAERLRHALTMSAGEQAFRMRSMRAVVARANTYRWAGEMLADATRLRTAETLSAARARDQPRHRVGSEDLFVEQHVEALEPLPQFPRLEQMIR
jgi:trehalose 6-phosphate synthase